MKRTEMKNPLSEHIDTMSAEEMVRLMQSEYVKAAQAVEAATADIARAVDGISERMKRGGRLIYVGCGTSGRLGVLDASECPPTFGVSPDLVVGIIAGGDAAMRRSVEGVEDDPEAGKAALAALDITEADSVAGISAAGGARYVLGALEAARNVGALTVGITCDADSPLSRQSDIAIVTDTGPEVVTGSTRMKAGSAHKTVLNMISTGVMIKLGMVYENHMINLRPLNEKLKKRMVKMTSDIAGVDAGRAGELLERWNWDVRKAVEHKNG